jgi:hypothetical protein
MGGNMWIGAPRGMMSTADYREACDYEIVGPEERIQRQKQAEIQKEKEGQIKEELDSYYASLHLEHISCHTFVPIKHALDKSKFHRNAFINPSYGLHKLCKSIKLNNRFKLSKEVVDTIDFSIVRKISDRYSWMGYGNLY